MKTTVKFQVEAKVFWPEIDGGIVDMYSTTEKSIFFDTYEEAEKHIDSLTPLEGALDIELQINKIYKWVSDKHESE